MNAAFGGFKNGEFDSCEGNYLMIDIALWPVSSLQSVDVKSSAGLGLLGFLGPKKQTESGLDHPMERL